MALTDFFRINLPYGMRRNANGEWFFFNREYVPLGWNQGDLQSIYDDNAIAEIPIRTKYKGLTESTLKKLAWNVESGIRNGDDGKIETVFFYNDATNPQSNPKYWNSYFEKIKLLSKSAVKK